MNLEKDRRNQGINVSYGKFDVAKNTQKVETLGLYSCIALVLVSKKKITLAHIPAVHEFTTIEAQSSKITFNPTTFNDLMSDLIRKTGSMSRIKKAIIVGGINGISDEKINQVQTNLIDAGLNVVKISCIGPHGDKEEWDITCLNGKVEINVREQQASVLGEYSY